MTIDITKLLLGIIEIIVGVIVVYLAPMVKAWLKSKVSERAYKNIEFLVEQFVSAAEQKYAESGKGPEKYAYVVEMLAKKNISLSAEELDAMIEAAVLKLKNAIVG